jgi:hypothetical protein
MSSREYITRRLVNPQGEITIWGDSILSAYKRVGRLAFLPAISYFRPSRFLILGSKIFNQLSLETRKQTHLVMSARDILRCSSRPPSFTYDLKSYGQMYAFITKHDEKAYAACRLRILKILETAKPTSLIANTTMDPINRLWIEVSSEMGIQTVCVQHGVYSMAVPKYVLEEDIVDRYVALDRGQADILKTNIAAEKIGTLGSRDVFEWRPPEGTVKVCFVGEDWERYGLQSVKRIMIDRYLNIINFLNASGRFDFYYKPHPSEEMMLNIGAHTTLLKPDQIALPDVYIGFASTFLKDMSSQKKLTIQIWDKATQSDNFEELGYCLSLDNNDGFLEKLRSTLQEKITVPFINNAKLDDLLFPLERV